MKLLIKSMSEAPTSINGVHESCYRASRILNAAKAMLIEGTPPTVVLAFIDGMETFGQREEWLTMEGPTDPSSSDT